MGGDESQVSLHVPSLLNLQVLLRGPGLSRLLL